MTKWAPLAGAALALAALACAQTVSFADACKNADERAVMASGLANPGLALRSYGLFAQLPFAQQAAEAFALADPEEAVGVAGSGAREADELRERLARSERAEARVVAELAADAGANGPERRKAAALAFEIARGNLTVEDAVRLAAQTPAYFARLTDLRFAAGGEEARGLDAALGLESLVLCRAVGESQGRGLADLAAFRARDLYLTLAYGRAEAADPVFAVVFDRLLAPKLRANKGAMAKLLDESHGVGLRQFAGGALEARRLDPFLALVGADAAARLARGIDGSANPVEEAVEMADLIAGTRDRALLGQLDAIVPDEYARVAAQGDERGKELYGLLAASLLAAGGPGADRVRASGAPYAKVLTSAATLDVAALFGAQKRCVERYFFWDDDDGVSSFEHFKSGYARDPAWKVEDRGNYVRITGRGPGGRTIEIWANRPIDIRLPANRDREDESLRRQAEMGNAMQAAGSRADVLVHRGHSFHVPKTLRFVEPEDRLVILGSCRGVGEIRAVMERSHGAQVIATRLKAKTELNDAMLKALNTALLSAGPKIDWKTFWSGKAAFQAYTAPSADPASVYLRGYYALADAK
jgi:hypothetical protein